MKKRGRPLLLGEKLDGDVKMFIQGIRDAGGVVTTSITMEAATAIVKRADFVREWWPNFNQYHLGKVSLV